MKIPTNICDFKIDFEVKHEAGHYLKVKFDWINVDPATQEITYPETDTGFFRDWQLLQIEGETPVEIESQEAIDPKKFASKSTTKSKPPAPAKGKTNTLEEITDNRPRTIKFIKDFAEENNGQGLEVTEAVALKFSEATFNIKVFEVNRETQEETLIETVTLDISGMLFDSKFIDVSLT